MEQGNQSLVIGKKMEKEYLITNLLLLILSFFLFIQSVDYPFNTLTFFTKTPFTPDEGHAGVVRSITNGLSQLNIPFNVNPLSNNNIGDVVIVLASKAAFYHVLELKKLDKIKLLIAGPNVSIDNPLEFFSFISNIDVYLTPALWCKKAYLAQHPEFENKIKVWFAGVNIDFFSPQNNRPSKNKDVLIYYKFAPNALCDEVEKIIKKYKYIPIKICYGSYSREQFKSFLENSYFAVFLSLTESQGLALAESWAMNVPTLVWNSQQPLEYLGVKYNITSACPYLNKQVGADWKNIKEFEHLVVNIEQLMPTFSPRTWTQQNMSDKASAQLLLDIIIETINQMRPKECNNKSFIK